MAVVETYSLQFLLEVIRKEHDLEDDDLKIMLMTPAFAFDAATHADFDDVSASQIAPGNGYTDDGESLANLAASIGTGQVDLDCDSVTWTASGDAIPTTGSAIIYNNTHATKTVIKCIDFGEDYDTADGKLFQINFTAGMASVKTLTA